MMFMNLNEFVIFWVYHEIYWTMCYNEAIFLPQFRCAAEITFAFVFQATIYSQIIFMCLSFY